MHNSDLNLLFGILALQLNFVTSEVLISAMGEWILAKEKSLGEILEASGKLSPERRQLLDSLVQEQLRQHSGDARQSLAAMSSVDSVRHVLEEVADPDLQASVAHLPNGEHGAHDGETVIQNDPQLKQLPEGSVARYFGEYEILNVLGAGGMGVVYKARQRKLGRIVALKLIRTGELASAQDVLRFQAEAKAAARLSHPGIVSVHEVGIHDGQHFYTMDYVAGGSLSQLHRDEPVPARRAAGMVRLLADAIHYSHGQGIVHRDLKPANVLMTPEGSPKITDFGLAKRMWADDGSPEDDMTQTGQILGTAGYMSPEQAAGKTRVVGPPADIYALGAVLYALLTSRAPFVGESQADTIQQVIHNEPVSPRSLNPGIARDLETICLKCLEKEPHKRYGTAQLLAEDLGRFLEGRPVHARPISSAARVGRWCRRNPWVATALTLLIAISLISPPIAYHEYYQSTKIGQQKADLEVNSSTIARLLKTETKLRKATESDANKIKDLLVTKEAALGQATVAEKKAKGAQKLAEDESAANFRTLYTTDMQRMAGLWDEANIRTMREHLARYIPVRGRTDLRDFEWYYWQRKCNQEIRQLHHGPEAALLALSPDGQWLATAGPLDSRRHGIQVRNLITGDLVGPLLDSSEKIVAVRFVAEGSQLVIVRQGRGDVATVLTWPANTTENTLQLLQELPPQVPLERKPTTRYAISPNGTLLAQSLVGIVNCRRLNDGQLIRIKLADQSFKRVRTYRQDRPPIKTPDGLYTYFRGDVPGQFRVRSDREVVDSPNFTKSHPGARRFSTQAWNLNDEFAPTSEEDGDPVFALEFSPDEKRLAAGSRHGDLIVWELSTGDELIRVPAHADVIWDIAFSTDGNQLATASKDGRIKIWDMTTKKLLTTIHGHSGAVRTVAYSKRGVLFSGGDDHVVHVWTPVTGKLVTSFRGHEQSVQDLALQPDGTKVLSSSRDGIVKEWSLENNERPIVIASRYPMTCLDISTRGNILAAAGSRSKAVTLWDLATGQITASLQGELPGSIIRLQISPNGDTVMAATSMGGITTWDLATKTIISNHNLSDQSNTLAAAAISPHARQAVGVSKDGKRHLFDLGAGAIVGTFQGEDRLERTQYSPDGTELLTFIRQDDALDIRLWNAETGAKEEDIPAGAAAEIAAFSGDGKLLAWGKLAGEKDSRAIEIQVWDRSATSVTSRLKVPSEFVQIRGLVFSPDQRLVAATVSRNLLPKLGTPGETALLIYDISTSRTLRQIDESGTALRFTPDGNWIAVASEFGNVNLWGLNEGQKQQVLARPSGPVMSVVYDSEVQLQAASQLEPLEGAVNVPVMLERTFISRQDPSRQRIVNGSLRIPMPRTVLNFDIFRLSENDPQPHWMILSEDEQKRADLRGPLKPFRLYAYAPAAKVMFALSSNGTLLRVIVRYPSEMPVPRVLPSNDFKQAGSGVGPAGNRMGAADDSSKSVQLGVAGLEETKVMAASSNGRWMALAAGNVIQLWDGEKLELRHTLRGHEASVRSLAFSSDGLLLASGGLDRSVRLWNTSDGMCRTTSLGHLKQITCLAFSKRGQSVVSSSYDGSIRLWDTITGEIKTTLTGHVGPVNWIEFSPAGDELASAGEDGTVRLWRAPQK